LKREKEIRQRKEGRGATRNRSFWQEKSVQEKKRVTRYAAKYGVRSKKGEGPLTETEEEIFAVTGRAIEESV